SGILMVGHYLFEQRTVFEFSWSKPDKVSLLALYLVSIPVYLWSVYTVPFQMNSDEPVLISVENRYLSHGITDVFGISDYFGFMYLPFLIQGWLAQLLGGVDLYHVRLLNAFAGTLIVFCSYVFFRVISLSWPMACVATVFVEFNHSLIDMSRIASRING